MVQLSKLLKLGGFSDQIQVLKAQVEHLGFAKKSLPPDTPHSEDKTRWSVNALGQKVVDTGTPVEMTRALYVNAAEKTFTIPQRASLQERTALIEERCDYILAICALAEKGDEPSGDYLVSLLQKDPVPAVRKLVLSKLAFAARGPRTPYNRRLIDAVLGSIADEVAEIRGMTVALHERAIREWDLAEIQVLIKPQKRKDVASRRGECTMVGEAVDAQARGRQQPVGGGAWQQVRDLAMAILDPVLMTGVLQMMSHPVLPVRMAAWDTFGGKNNSSTKGRCRELEVLAYQKKLDYEKQVMKESLLQIEADACLENIMEAAREKITERIENERKRAELTASDVEKIVNNYRDELAGGDPEYKRLLHQLVRHQKSVEALKEDLKEDSQRYMSVMSDLKEEIMSMIGSLLEERNNIIEAVNKLCGSNDKGNWYVRRCLVRILEPMAVSGDKAALQLLEKAKDDKSPYVRRTVQRSLRAVWLAERERTAAAEISDAELIASRPTSAKEKTAEEQAAADLKDALKGIGGSDEDDEEKEKAEPTLEEKRRALKAMKQKQEAAEEEARINALNVSRFTWKDVDQMIETIRPKFGDKTDGYRKLVRQKQINGEQMVAMSEHEEEFSQALKMKTRKHRIALKLYIKSLMDKWREETDESKAELRAQNKLMGAARDNANKLNALTKVKLSQTGGASVKSAYRFDNYAYGSATGLGSMLHRDDKGNVIFRKVIPCGGLVNEGDTLLKIGNTPVSGMGLIEVKRLFDELGERTPCLVRLTSEKVRMKAIEDQAKDAREREEAGGETKDGAPGRWVGKEGSTKRRGPMLTDLLRTVHVTCQPPPFREEYLESIGLDVEVYQGDASRSLQVMTLLQRNGFTSLLSKCLVDLKVKTLKELAERYNDDAWIDLVGIKSRVEREKFKRLLERLAFRYGMRDHMPDINREDTRPDAHKGWIFISGCQNAVQNHRYSQYRTYDASEDISQFKRFGRTPIVLSSVSKGMEYTVCWHPELKIAVELMHSSAGTLRFAKLKDERSLKRTSSVERTDSLPGIPGTFDFYVVFSDGRIENADRLNATALLQELVSQPPPEKPADSRPGTTGDFARPSTQQSHLPSISGAMVMENIREEETKPLNRQGTPEKDRPGASVETGGLAVNPWGHPAILTSGAHLGSPTKWNKDSRFLSRTRPSSASSDATNAPRENANTWEKALGRAQIGREDTFEVRDRAWYVKGAGRGPSRGYSGQRTFVKQGDKWLPTNPTDAAAAKWPTLMASGGNMGFFGGPKRGPQKDDDDSEAESEIDSDDEEEVLGYHVEPLVGHRVVLRKTVRKKFPELVKETANSTGTVTWVDPTDADGDGITGDISEVQWDNGYKGDYRTGFEGTYRLCLDPEEDEVNQRINIGALDDEQVIGLDVEPLEGQRVVLMAESLKDPELFDDSKGGPGTILWVDPEDADGDGITGDICEVQWDMTNVRADYRTGFEGCFRLALFDPEKYNRQQREFKKKEAVATKKSLGRKGLKTIDQNRKQPPDDPWKFWEEATAEEKRLEDAELAVREAFHPVEFVPFRMMAAGTRSQLRAGSWMISTCAQNNGTTIEVKYDPVLKILGDHSRLANDAKRLGMRYTHSSRQHYISEQAKHVAAICPTKPLAVHLTGEGVVVIAEEPVPDGFFPVSKTVTRPPLPGRATVVTPSSGLEDMGVEEAGLVVEGIPRHSIADVLSLKRNESIETPAGKILQGDDGFSGSESGSRPISRNSSSRPGSRGHARMSKRGENPVPQSIRSTKRNAAHERPITPATGKPYTALRPSSRGSVRHSLNLEDAFAVGQDMQSRDPTLLHELKSQDGDYKREMRLAHEANVIIEDDEVR